MFINIIKDQFVLDELRLALGQENLDIVKWPDFYDYASLSKSKFYDNFYFIPFVW